MERIGIFGGTFNPIHLGHAGLIEQIKKQKQLDRVLIIPTNCPPHKDSSELADNQHRLAMCKLAFEQMEGFEVSDLEFTLGGSSYTIITLLELKRAHPDDALYLIVGSDMIFSFDTWKDHQQILKNAIILVGARNEHEHRSIVQKANELMALDGGTIEVVNIDVTELSSTEVRTRLRQCVDCSDCLDPKVLCYIFTNRLYQSGKNLDAIKLIVRKMLDRSRFEHTKCVAKTAVQLAKQFGGDVQKAELSAYLHDVMKNQEINYLLQYFDKNGILLSTIEKQSPPLWHAIAGSVFIQKELGIDDIDIINAVRYHTTARANMSLLEKIVYVADCISDDRDFDGVKQQRKLAKYSLDDALLHSLKSNIAHLAETQKPLHPDSIQAYHSLINHMVMPTKP